MYLVRNYGGAREIEIAALKVTVQIEKMAVCCTDDKEIALALAKEEKLHVVRRMAGTNSTLPLLQVFKRDKYNVLTLLVPQTQPFDLPLTGNMEGIEEVPLPQKELVDLEIIGQLRTLIGDYRNKGDLLEPPKVRGKMVMGAAQKIRDLFHANKDEEEIIGILLPSYLLAGRTEEKGKEIISSHIVNIRKEMAKE